MTQDEIAKTMAAIAAGDYPDEPVVGVGAPFLNTSGSISNIAWGGFESASYITSTDYSVRSNHYHKEDAHFIFLVDGLMLYYFRKVGEGKISRRACHPGELIFTPPQVEHATYFPLATRMITLNRRRRDHQSHEADLVRVLPLIRPSEVCSAVFEGFKCILPFEDGPREALHPVHGGFHLGIVTGEAREVLGTREFAF